jgi:outer membrane protein OmpA-like peptidoglycan-associated protein
MRTVNTLVAAGCLAAWTLTAAPQPARAQDAVPLDRSFELNLFQPAIGPRNLLQVDTPEVPIHRQFSFGLVTDYQRHAYRIYSYDFNSQMPIQGGEYYPLANQLKSELQAAMGLLDKYQVGISLPFTALVNGDMINPMTGSRAGTFSGSGLGDLRLEAKGQLWTAGEDDQLVLGALVGGTLPTGDGTLYLGDRSVTGRVKALASYQLGQFNFAGQAGVLLRQESTTISAKVGSQLLYGGGASYQVMKGFVVLAEVAGRSGLSEFGQRWWDQNPVEADIAARGYPMGMLALTGGIGAGLGKGIGAPRMRVFLAAVFTPDFRDGDRDGVYDADDQCPDQAEDRDGFKDADGCPEADNDADAIPDVSDKCPNEVEDLDQHQDEDGCPDPDNDNDGIDDLHDPCPNAAEDGQGKRPKDGCPSTSEDSDGDGVNDTIDKCADEPEDQDQFQDDDGCPDPDNDNDGIPDGFDNCPMAAEDTDSFEDEDGCPDPDNDKDAFLDAQDKCPNEPETLNGKQDDDGCPDPGAAIVKLGEGRIEVTEKISFAGKGATTQLREASAGVVGLVALVLKGNPQITKLRIEVHADSISKEETQRRADLVRDVLVRKGVEAERLLAVGAGAGGSRVDFVITDTATAKPGAPAPGAAPPPAAAPPAAPPGSAPPAAPPGGGGTQ